MNAILLAPGFAPDMSALCSQRPCELLPVLNRPLLQRVVEVCAQGGITDFHIILSHEPQAAEELLGNGERWGVSMTYHLARDPEHPYAALPRALEGADSLVLLAHADSLPVLDPSVWEAGPDAAPSIHVFEKDGKTEWTGWALLAPSDCARIPADASRQEAGEFLLALAEEGTTLVPTSQPPLSCRNYADLLHANALLLGGKRPDLHLEAREADPGVRICRNVSLHPTARIHPPIYIGENCRIGSRCELGPDVVIGNGCVLDDGAIVQNSVVLAGTYVGEGLELDGVVVEHNRLANAELGVELAMADEFLLGSIENHGRGRWIYTLCERVLALLGLLAFLPLLILLWAWARGKGTVSSTDVLRLPASTDQLQWTTFRQITWTKRDTPGAGSFSPWQHFLLIFLPGLVHVLRSEMHLVGLPPRTPAEMEELPPEWRSVILLGRLGLITEPDLVHGPERCTDDSSSAELYQTVAGGFGHDFHLACRYISRLLVGRW
jgi:NDP-sugar pyrophosphorylase family protein